MATITCEMPDGAMVSFDRVRRQFIVTAKGGAVITTHRIPVRPNPPKVGSDGKVVEENLSPMTKEGYVEKLGYKKQPVTGAHIWNKRYIKLTKDTVTYGASETDVKGTLELSAGSTCRVIQAREPARKDRFEDNDNQGVFSMMTQSIGSMASIHGSAIGKPNCVELHIPAKIGDMLGGIMGASAMSLAFGGGAKEVNKNKARTYYFSCETEELAKEWCKAIENNIKIKSQAAASNADGSLDKAKGAGGAPNTGGFNAASLGQIDGALNYAHGMAADQKTMNDPDQCLGWFKRNMQTTVSTEELYKRLIAFYDQLKAAGVEPKAQ